ncbi:FMN-binding protein [Actinomadura barringtoniae]|uniref:FMN-binding protein n=1 Tax=Actinomadura barringtoniae TaxID=1427535 RepID=A0A939PE22_9ACTN|nr:FMN-binding protein [Actinomadura barringtoniae]MBO2450915.1 FMN-binding protein [Actinomadura barringtoniae]
MRRTTAAVAGTLSGAALILAAKFGTGAVAAPVASEQTTDDAGGLTPSAGPSQPSSRPPASRAPQTGQDGQDGQDGQGDQAGQGGQAGQAANGLKNGIFRGDAVRNQYGPIQVTIQIAAGRITGLTATHATSPAMTVQVNERAIPLLRKETLEAQSAQIDGVSGATFTTGSFKNSLQSALTAAKA